MSSKSFLPKQPPNAELSVSASALSINSKLLRQINVFLVFYWIRYKAREAQDLCVTNFHRKYF